MKNTEGAVWKQEILDASGNVTGTQYVRQTLDEARTTTVGDPLTEETLLTELVARKLKVQAENPLVNQAFDAIGDNMIPRERIMGLLPKKDATGSFINLTDAANFYLDSLSLKGKSLYMGESVTNPTVTIGMENLFIPNPVLTLKGKNVSNQLLEVGSLIDIPNKLFKKGDELIMSYDWTAAGTLTGDMRFQLNAPPWKTFENIIATGTTLPNSGIHKIDNGSGHVTMTGVLDNEFIASSARIYAIRLDYVPSSTTVTISNIQIKYGNLESQSVTLPGTYAQSLDQPEIRDEAAKVNGIYSRIQRIDTDGTILSDPVVTEFDAPLQEQLNALETYEGTTNIFTDSPLSPELTVRYVKSFNVE